MHRWDPWRGCKKYSEGCLNCYIHRGDVKRGVKTENVMKTKDFLKPIRKDKKGSYIMKSGLVYMCFSSDFLIEDADLWRLDCWKMIKQRSDCTFLFLTKRIDRFIQIVPDDWGSGYENVVVCCTIEDQQSADHRLSLFLKLPIIHKIITAQPLIEKINIEKYLHNIEEVVVGGESGVLGRPLDYDWVLNLRQQCLRRNTNFTFRQCGSHFVKDGKHYKIPVKELIKQAKLANIDFQVNQNQ